MSRATSAPGRRAYASSGQRLHHAERHRPVDKTRPVQALSLRRLLARCTGSPRFNVEIWQDGGARVRTSSFSELDFEDCVFEAADDENLDFAGAALSSDNVTPANGPCHVTGCTFKGNGRDYRWFGDIVCEGGAGRLTIEGNTFYGGAGWAFAASNNGADPDVCGYNTFSDNVINPRDGVLNTGIPFSGHEYVSLYSRYNTVRGNRITNNSAGGRCIDIGGSFNTVRGNTLTNSLAADAAVHIQEGADNNVVTGNTLIGGGIADEGGSNTITPNP